MALAAAGFSGVTAGPLWGQHPPVLRGRVLDRVSGAPVVGARIRVDGSPVGTVSEAAGAFELRGLLPGVRGLRVDAMGYRTGHLEVVARNGIVVTVRVELDPDPLAVRGLRAEGMRPRGTPARVLERSELEGLAAVDLADALRSVPGLVVTRAGGPGSAATVSIRGASPDQVLVLLDGIPMNAPLTGGVDLSTVSVRGVERVTVLPGGQSARYGPRALGGVILVESRRPGDTEIRARASAGSWGTMGFAADLGGRGRLGEEVDLSGRLTGEWRSTQADFRYAVPDVRGGGAAIRLNGDARTVSLNGSAAVAAGGIEVRAAGDVLDLQRGMPGPVTAPSPTARQSQRRLTLGGTATLVGRISWDLALDARRQRARFFDPFPPAGAPFDDETRARGLGVRVGARAVAADVEIDAGVEGRHLDVESTALVADGPGSVRSLGAWVAGTVRRPVGPWIGRVTGGLRVDGHSAVSSAMLSPRIAVSLTGQRWTLRGSVGGGFSPPSLADQFFQEGVLVRPNPLLGPERVGPEFEGGLDLRILTHPVASLGATLDVYRADVDGMILWFPDHRFVWSPDNVDVQRRGFEAALDMRLAPASARIRAAVARSSVTYAHEGLRGQVAFRPAWTGHAALAAGDTSLSGELSVRYVGERRTVPGAPVNALRPYWTTDLSVTATGHFAGWRAETRLSLRNALDAAAAMLPDYPLPGRGVGLEVAVSPVR